MEKSEKINLKREQLKEISQAVKPLIKSGQFDSVNDAIMELFYRKDGHEEFNTLHDWNKKGYKVIKGSSAFLVWGTPRNLKGQPNEQQQQPTEENEQENKFYPLCYLFSNLQVERRTA